MDEQLYECDNVWLIYRSDVLIILKKISAIRLQKLNIPLTR